MSEGCVCELLEWYSQCAGLLMLNGATSELTVSSHLYRQLSCIINSRLQTLLLEMMIHGLVNDASQPSVCGIGQGLWRRMLTSARLTGQLCGRLCCSPCAESGLVCCLCCCVKPSCSWVAKVTCTLLSLLPQMQTCSWTWQMHCCHQDCLLACLLVLRL